MASELEAGKDVYLKMPYGTLAEEINSDDEVVFIAGGTGITPFLSLFSDKSFISFKRAHLYFGLRNKEMNIYDLSAVSSSNPNFISNVIYEDESGKLDIEKIMAAHPDAVYVISGPQQMIKIFKAFIYEHKGELAKIITHDWE